MYTAFADKVTSLCLEICKLDVKLPVVRDTENNSKAFSWTEYYPLKELEIWLFDQEDYYAEGLLSIGNTDKELILTSEEDVISLITKYIEIKFVDLSIEDEEKLRQIILSKSRSGVPKL